MNSLPPNDRSTDLSIQDPKCPRLFDRYRVLLHRSQDKDLMFIVRTVMEIAHFAKEEATHRMWESYQRGSATILSCHRERAELYVEQFAEKGLQVTFEMIQN